MSDDISSHSVGAYIMYMKKSDKHIFKGGLAMFKLEFNFNNNKIEGGTLVAILLIIVLVVIILVR